MKHIIIFLLSLILFSVTAQARLTHYALKNTESSILLEKINRRYHTNCQTITTKHVNERGVITYPILYKFCLSRDKWERSKKVLYFFHGVNGSPRDWLQKLSLKKIRNFLWARSEASLPAVASVSFGNMYFLGIDKTKDLFLHKVMPHIENLIGGDIQKRLLMGVSMGGANVAQLILKEPQYFNGAVMICPAIINIHPWSSYDEVDDYIMQTGAWKFLIDRFITSNDLILENFKDFNHYNTKANVYYLAPTNLGPQTPPLYISVGENDQFGFQQGSHFFADWAIRNGVPTTFHSYPGKGHCVLNAETIGKYLLKQLI